MHASLLRAPVGSGKDRGALLLHTRLLCWPVAPGGRPPPPGRRVWTARQSRAEARLPPTRLGSCSHSRSRHAASSDFPAARVSPCAGAWRGRGVPFLPLQLPFGKFTPRPLPVPTSNARQEALVPRTHVALAGSGRQRPRGKSTDVSGSVTATDPFLPRGTVGTGHTGLSHPSGHRARPEVALSPGTASAAPKGPLPAPGATGRAGGPLYLLDTPALWAGCPLKQGNAEPRGAQVLLGHGLTFNNTAAHPEPGGRNSHTWFTRHRIPTWTRPSGPEGTVCLGNKDGSEPARRSLLCSGRRTQSGFVPRCGPGQGPLPSACPPCPSGATSPTPASRHQPELPPPRRAPGVRTPAPPHSPTASARPQPEDWHLCPSPLELECSLLCPASVAQWLSVDL
uniref:Uncharacterized protein n=1 Tax=Myotis myotis TaxID=51298 RepID=A0A7J7SRL2_MYOMY|nr:hypothetical protein mMyoMyo1_009423 [Myotis myotis]